MGATDGVSWARDVFGEVAGPRLRELLPHLVVQAHAAMAQAQDVSGLAGQYVYGLVWRRTLQAFAEGIPRVVPHARELRVPHAGYRVVAVNDVAIYPWRYGRTAEADPWAARLGEPPSDARKAILRGVRAFGGQLELELPPWPPAPVDSGDSAVDAPAGDLVDVPPDDTPGDSDDDRSADADAPSVLVALTQRHRTVVVVRYASARSGVLRLLWGDGRLQDDGTVRGFFGEDLRGTCGRAAHGRLSLHP